MAIRGKNRNARYARMRDEAGDMIGRAGLLSALLARDPDENLQLIERANRQKAEISSGYEDQLARLVQEKKSIQHMLSEQEEESRSNQRHLAELKAAASLSTALRSARTVPDMLTILLTEVCHSLAASAAAVLLLHNNTLVITNLHGLPAGRGHLVVGVDAVVDRAALLVRTARPVPERSIPAAM